MPPGAKPEPDIRAKPTRSASRSMSREKLSCPCAASAWLPTTVALTASALLLPARLAASRPTTNAARLSKLWCLLLAMLRAMWRCVMCDSSCASTDASSSRVAVMAINPRCTPM